MSKKDDVSIERHGGPPVIDPVIAHVEPWYTATVTIDGVEYEGRGSSPEEAEADARSKAE